MRDRSAGNDSHTTPSAPMTSVTTDRVRHTKCSKFTPAPAALCTRWVPRAEKNAPVGGVGLDCVNDLFQLVDALSAGECHTRARDITKPRPTSATHACKPIQTTHCTEQLFKVCLIAKHTVPLHVAHIRK